MKVTIDGRYIRTRASGIKSYTLALVKEFSRIAPNDQFEVWIHPDSEVSIPDSPNISYRVVSAPANGPGTLINTGGLGNLEDTDVFHATFNILGHGVRCPTVVTIHDMRWVEDPRLCEANPLLRPFRTAFMRLGIRNALLNANRILTVSQASADVIVKYFPRCEERISITPCACEPCFVLPDSIHHCQQRAAEILGTSSPYFLAVGVNAIGKGHDILVKAFAAAAKSDERLVFVHRIDGSPSIESLAHELGVYDRISWCRGLSEQDLVTLIQAAKVFVQPSRYEGFGIPVLEAMSCGAPVISSDIPALTEVLGGAGYTVPCGEVPELAQAMRLVSDDSGLRAEMRERGIARARTYSWRTSSQRTLETYAQSAAQSEYHRQMHSHLDLETTALKYQF